MDPIRSARDAAVVGMVWAMCSMACGQVPGVGPARDAQFEVASMKPDDAKASAAATNLDLDATDYSRYRGGPVVADGYMINYLIFAYKIANAGEYRRLDMQLPKWAQSGSGQTFRLEARAGEETTKEEMRGMVRSLLVERFGLKVHRETQQQLAWVLTETKGGEKRASTLRPHTGEPVCDKVGAGARPAVKPREGEMPATCGTLVMDGPEGIHLRIMDYSMALIAGELSMYGERSGGMEELPGVDGTGRAGKFDLDLHFVQRKGPGASDEQAMEAGLDFLQALSAQAGLEFKKRTVPVEVLVVDQVSAPTPD